MNKILSSILLMTSLVFIINDIPVYASHTVPVEVEMEAPVFDVTLPTSLPVTIKSDGTVITASTAKVINNSSLAVNITDIDVYTTSEYSIVPFGSYMGGTSPVFAMKINNLETTYGDSTLPLFSPINLLPKAELPIIYDARTIFHKTSKVVSPMNVMFTAEFGIPRPAVGTRHTIDEYEYSYGQYYDNEWKDMDTSLPESAGYGVRTVDNTQTEYYSPESEIDGVPVTNMYKLFAYNKGRSIVLNDNFDTSNVINMSFMFYESMVREIYVDMFDTSKVQNMSNMFSNATSTKIYAYGFDTRNVTNMSGMYSYTRCSQMFLVTFRTEKVKDMSYMFAGSSGSPIDLSSFKLADDVNVDHMFEMASGTVGYGGSQKEIDVFESATTNKPDTLVFSIGSSIN